MILRIIYQKYHYHLQERQRNRNPQKVERLEEKRITLHNQLLDALTSLGLPFTDQDDAMKLAWKHLNKT
jgi:hypothetical protein